MIEKETYDWEEEPNSKRTWGKAVLPCLSNSKFWVRDMNLMQTLNSIIKDTPTF